MIKKETDSLPEPRPGAFRFPDPSGVGSPNVLMVREMMHNWIDGESRPVGILARKDGDIRAWARAFVSATVVPCSEKYGDRFPRLCIQLISPFGCVNDFMGPIPRHRDRPGLNGSLADTIIDALLAELGAQLRLRGDDIISFHHGDVKDHPLIDAGSWLEPDPDRPLIGVSYDAASQMLRTDPNACAGMFVDAGDQALEAGQEPADTLMFESGVWEGASRPYGPGLVRAVRKSGARFLSVVGDRARAGENGYRPTIDTLLGSDIPLGNDAWIVNSRMTIDEIEGVAGFCARRGDWFCVPSHAWHQVIRGRGEVGAKDAV